MKINIAYGALFLLLLGLSPHLARAGFQADSQVISCISSIRSVGVAGDANFAFLFQESSQTVEDLPEATSSKSLFYPLSFVIDGRLRQSVNLAQLVGVPPRYPADRLFSFKGISDIFLQRANNGDMAFMAFSAVASNEAALRAQAKVLRYDAVVQNNRLYLKYGQKNYLVTQDPKTGATTAAFGGAKHWLTLLESGTQWEEVLYPQGKKPKDISIGRFILVNQKVSRLDGKDQREINARGCPKLGDGASFLTWDSKDQRNPSYRFYCGIESVCDYLNRRLKSAADLTASELARETTAFQAIGCQPAPLPPKLECRPVLRRDAVDQPIQAPVY